MHYDVDRLHVVYVLPVCPRLDNIYRGRLAPSGTVDGVHGEIHQGLHAADDLRHRIEEVHVKVAAGRTVELDASVRIEVVEDRSARGEVDDGPQRPH